MPRRAPRIAVLPYATPFPRGLARVPLTRLHWPLEPAPDGGAVGDLLPDDHLIVFPSLATLLAPHRGVRAQLTPMLVEPRAVQPWAGRIAAALYRRFFAILTCDRAVLAAAPNAVPFTYGGSWVPDWRTRDLTKTAGLSLIASRKRALPGHRLRHEIARRLAADGIAADVMGGGYRPFADKGDGHAPYRFSVVIENSRQHGYFTEKLIDAILCRSVPIYWGDPAVAAVFDPAGMILCDDAEAILAACRDTGPDAYAARLPALLANIPRAAAYADPLGNAARAVLARAAVRG